jgi:putative nucleotidyltransferase with HDIG domain
VRALTSAIDAKDPYTHGHSERVARVAVCIGEEMGLDKEQLDTIYLGGLLHDIGKIGIDDQVLNKPGALTPEEYEHIKKHPQLGYDILRGVRQLQKILPIVLHHHESWDGTGYPHGLTGESTPLVARIAAVADAFDAMSSDRPYRQGMEDEKLDAILRDGAGKQWDPAVVDAFFACREKIRQAAADDTIGAVGLDPLQWVH